MNWEAIGAIGEIFGGVAVLATLIYLAIQVRQAKRQLNLNSVQARASHARELMLPVAIDPSLASIMIKAGHPPYGNFDLDPEEAHRFGAWCHAWMQTEQGNHYLLPEGEHDDLLKLWLLLPAYAEFWEKNNGIYDDEFVQRMERLKQEIDVSRPAASDLFSGDD